MAGESGAAPGNRAVRRLRSLAGLPPIDRAAFGAIARTELPQIARIVIVAAVGWQVCLWLGAQDPPIYAVLVPLVSLKSDPFSAFNLSWSRLVGVLIGLLLGLAVLRVMSPGLLAISVVLAASLLLGMLVRIGNQPNMQVAVSALLVFSNPDASAYGLTRLWETGVGTAVTALLTRSCSRPIRGWPPGPNSPPSPRPLPRACATPPGSPAKRAGPCWTGPGRCSA